MSQIIDFLAYNWSSIFLCAIVLVSFVFAIYEFFKKPSSAQLDSVKAWLLSAVTIAEKEFGSGTGAVKLSYVYSLFVEKFPALARLVNFDMFSGLVDEVLERFRNILKSNNNLQSYVNPNTTKEGE